MKTKTNTKAAVLTNDEIAQLNTTDLSTLTPAQRRRLDARARATMTACNRVIRTARRMGARNAGKGSQAWDALNRYRAAKHGVPVKLYVGTAAEFALQGLDCRREAQRSERFAKESFESARGTN
jgi:hypothetical protein